MRISALAHFGLGASASVDKLVIHWPGGATQEVTGVEIDRVLTVEQAPSSEPGDTEGDR